MEEKEIIDAMQAMCEESCSPDMFAAWERLKEQLMKTRRNLREPRRYWQHGETGRIASTENAIDLSESGYAEISEAAYFLTLESSCFNRRKL